MIRRLAILLPILAELCYHGDAKRQRTTLKHALRHLHLESINWTAENLEFQKIFDNLPASHTFQRYVTTVLPTLKYQRGVNLTAYEISIRKEQAKLDKVINETQQDIDARRARWESIRDEMVVIRKNLSQIRRKVQSSPNNTVIQNKKKELVKQLKDLKTKYNITPDDRDSFEIAYSRARVGVVRMLKKHTRFYMNKTKFYYDFILRKNELSDELYDLKENITKLDMLINENMEQETLAPEIRIKDIVDNLTDVITSINTKGYKYRRAKKGMQFLITIMNRFLNKSKTAEAERRKRIPPEFIEVNAEIRNLTARLTVKNERISELQKLLKEKDEEYHDVKYAYYRKKLNLREVHMERFVWEMNLTNFLKERVRKDLLEMFHTPEPDHLLQGHSSIDIKDNLFLDMIDHENYWRSHLRYNRTTTQNYEWMEVEAQDEACRKYMHDNWFSFESLRHKYDRKKRRRRRRRHVVRDTKREKE